MFPAADDALDACAALHTASREHQGLAVLIPSVADSGTYGWRCGITTNLAIAVVGLGGAGCAVVQGLAETGLPATRFVALDADWARLASLPEMGSAYTQIRCRSGPRRGMGSGGNPTTGAQAVDEGADLLHEHLRGADLAFISAGLGGGTGSGGAPVAARTAREAGALTVGIATLPFAFEGPRRRALAEDGLAALRREADAVIVIPCARLLQVLDKRTDILAVFRDVDGIVCRSIRALAEAPVVSGLFRVDLSDVRALMSPRGRVGLIGLGSGVGEDRVLDATRNALACPLLSRPIAEARGILLDVRTGPDLALVEVAEARELVARCADSAVEILVLATPEPAMRGGAEVTIVATGYDAP